MKELTDKQCREITIALNKAGFTLRHGEGGWPNPAELAAAGRAVYAASFPYAVAEALEEPTNRECDEAIALAPKVQGNRYECIEAAFANRLARLTAKPDPAVEAAYQKMRMQAGWPHPDGEESKRLRIRAQDIVAAVDEARKGAK